METSRMAGRRRISRPACRPRARLWDTTYLENSWIPSAMTGNKPVAILARTLKSIDTAWPGTRLALTEYNYGGENHWSGALAQADVLGVFGKLDLEAANVHTTFSGYLRGGLPPVPKLRWQGERIRRYLRGGRQSRQHGLLHLCEPGFEESQTLARGGDQQILLGPRPSPWRCPARPGSPRSLTAFPPIP